MVKDKLTFCEICVPDASIDGVNGSENLVLAAVAVTVVAPAEYVK